MVEFDVKLSQDGEIFLLHDDTLDRTSNGRGVAGEQPWEKLLQLDVGSWYSADFAHERLPLLSQVAERCARYQMMANIEIKSSDGLEAETGHALALAARQLWYGQTAPLLSSFSFTGLEAAMQAAPELPRGMLLHEWRDNWREITEKLACVSVHFNHKILSRRRINEVKAAGLRMLVYTVNTPERACELLERGVDAICTDRIDLLPPEFAAGLTMRS